MEPWSLNALADYFDDLADSQERQLKQVTQAKNAHIEAHPDGVRYSDLREYEREQKHLVDMYKVARRNHLFYRWADDKSHELYDADHY